jgi:thymidylate synthase
MADIFFPFLSSCQNIHFFSTLIDHVAKELNVPVGEYTHWITNVCLDRSATSC